MKSTTKKRERTIYYWLITIGFMIFASWYIGEKIGRLIYNLTY